MKMKRNKRSRSDKMEDKAFMRAITRFLNGDQYLDNKCVKVMSIILNLLDVI